MNEISSVSVFRYMDIEHVDEFFNSGRLMLTSYARCIAHESEVRRDTNEGKLNFLTSRGVYAIAGIQRVGAKSYMLCASKSKGGALKQRFGANSYFAIRDISAFSKAVALQVPNVVETMVGQCEYVEERSLSYEDASQATFDEPILDMSRVGVVPGYVEEFFHSCQRSIAKQVAAATGNRAYFFKEMRFSEEAEFRFVWQTQSTADGFLFVNCPDAVEFCERPS